MPDLIGPCWIKVLISLKKNITFPKLLNVSVFIILHFETHVFFLILLGHANSFIHFELWQKYPNAF